jgi:uncharacterized membrane protein
VLALTWYEWFKSGHVLAAVIWVGGAVVMNVLAFLTKRENDPDRMVHFAKQAEWVGTRIFTPMSLVVLGLGFGLMENGQSPWTYDLTWVQIALAGWGASFLIGLLFLGPESGRLAKLQAERPPTDPEVQRRINRIVTIARADAVLLLFIVFDMTAKPFS